MVDSELHFLLNCFLSNFYGCNHMVLNWFSLQILFHNNSTARRLQRDEYMVCIFIFFFRTIGFQMKIDMVPLSFFG